MLNCNMMVRSLRRITIEARELPTDVGATNVGEPSECCKKVILEQKQQGVQMGTLCATTAQGWSTRQKTRRKWRKCRRQACV